MICRFPSLFPTHFPILAKVGEPSGATSKAVGPVSQCLLDGVVRLESRKRPCVNSAEYGM